MKKWIFFPILAAVALVIILFLAKNRKPSQTSNVRLDFGSGDPKGSPGEKTLQQAWDSVFFIAYNRLQWDNLSEEKKQIFRKRTLEIDSTVSESVMKDSWNHQIARLQWDSLSGMEQTMVLMAYSAWKR